MPPSLSDQVIAFLHSEPRFEPVNELRLLALAAASLYTSTADLTRLAQAHFPGANGEPAAYQTSSKNGPPTISTRSLPASCLAIPVASKASVPR